MRRDTSSGRSAVSSEEPAQPRWRSSKTIVAAGAAVAVLAGLAAWLIQDFAPEPLGPEKSVAVLPLVTPGGGEDDEYFSTGLTEDIVTQLSKIPDLEVASSISSLRYRNTDKSLEEIGEDLGVATLLVGRIRRQADQVRVNVELIDAGTSRNLWAEVFQSQMSDIFAMQTEIAEKLAAQLEVELSTETEQALEQTTSVDPEAYELTLRGRYLRKRENRANLIRAAEYFEQATQKDPDYAMPWAELAEASLGRVWMWRLEKAEPELVRKGVRAVERALELDDTLAEAHVANSIRLAFIAPRDAAAAERELKRAIELNPRLANAHRELAVQLIRTMGRVDEALDAALAADRLEPFWFLVKGHLIEAYLAKGDLVKAAETAREGVGLDDPQRRDFVAWTTAALQDYEHPLLLEAVQLERPYWGAPLVLSLSGRTEEATALASLRLQQLDPPPVFVDGRYRMAGVVALFAGDNALAIRHLKRAYEIDPDPVRWGGWGSSVLFGDHATLLGYALLKTGDKDRALRLFEETERFYTDRIVGGDTTIRARVGIAAVHALRGDKEAAYDWLQRAIDVGFFQYAELERHPCFETLHGEARFQQMMAGVSARVEEMRRQVAGMDADS